MTTPVDERESEALAQRQLDAYNARDLEAFAACFADDVEMRLLGSETVAWKGREALRKSYGPMFRDSPELHCELVNRIVMGPYVFDQEKVTGRGGGTGTTRVVATYEVRDGLIARIWFARPES
jgi:uncharacterized protein (TIGR02246 family)